MGNHNRCSSCHKDKCGCAPDPVISREIIQDDPAYCVVVNGDYEAAPDDEVIHVKAGTNAKGDVVVPTITLADPCDGDCARITIVAQGVDVPVKGLNNQNAVPPGDGTYIVAAGSAVTFWLTEDNGGDCNCGTSADYWIPQCCIAPTPPPPPTA